MSYETELPSYMYAADLHNVANGKPSLTDDYSTFDHVTKGTLTTIARGITSAFNTVPAVANWFGADIPLIQTDEVLRSFDDNLANYYVDNREVVDVVGDIAGSFVPGMAAVKGLNYAQKALAGVNRAGMGGNMARAFGTLPTKGEKLIEQAKMSLAQGDKFSIVDSSVVKAFGTKYAQNALEAGVFEIAAASTMGEYSPLFKDHTASDILYNSALGGGIVGGGILGTVSAVQTYGALKKASAAVDKVLNPFRKISESPEGVDEFVKILDYKRQLDTPMETVDEASRKALEARNRNLKLGMQESLNKLSGGDNDLAFQFYKAIEGMDQDTAWKSMLHMQEIQRGGIPILTKTDSQIAQVTTLRNKLKNLEEGSWEHTEILEKLDELRTVNKKFVHLATGQAFHEVPDSAFSLADKYTLPEIESKLARTLIKDGENWSPLGKSVEEVELRYVRAAQTPMKDGAFISSSDLPRLEAAWNQNLKEVAIDGVTHDRMMLWNAIVSKKEKMIDDYMNLLDVDPSLNTHKIAKTLNVELGLIEGGGYKVDDLAKGWQAKSNFAESYKVPEWVQIGYKRESGVDGNVERGMVVIKELQNAQEADNLKAVTAVFGEEGVAQLIKLTDADVLSSTSAGAGAGLLTLASGEYLTTASKVEWLGKVTNQLKVKGQKEVNDIFQPLMHSVMQNQKAGTELAILRQQILETGEKYVWVNGEAVHQAVAKYEAGLTKVAPELPEGVLERIAITQPETKAFMDQWVGYNNEWLRKNSLLRNAVGKGGGEYTDIIHFPQPDPSRFKFFSFVVPKNPTEADKVQMIWAASPEQLASLESKVDSNYTVIHKTDTEKFFKAKGTYDYDLGMNSYEIRDELKRTGAAAPFFPVTDPQQLLQEMLTYRHKMSDRLVRDGVSLHNSQAFSEFRRLAEQHTAIQKSTKGAAVVDSPFESYVKTALDIPNNAHVPVWTNFNNLAEDVYTRIASKLGDAWKGLKSPEDLAKLNSQLEEAGVRGFKDSMTELWANHPADKRLLSQHVLAANSAIATLVLRLDPMNALNNGVGANVLTGSEMAHIWKLAKEVDPEGMKRLAEVGVPGTQATIKSPVKLWSSGISDLFALMRGDAAMVKFKEMYSKNGWMPDFMEQMRQVADGATLTGVETAGELKTKLSQMASGLGNLGEKYTGNKMAEEANRFLAARAAHKISDVLVASGKMSDKEQLAFINTFVNRTQGNYLASQRPMIFQGAVGHAISLFQTYQFNMMQHVFRHVANGDKKQLAILMGLQGSIYGMNGLPAFNFLNQTLVGNAAGNLEHEDAFTYLKRAGDVGDFLLYGGLSNFTGLGLYSRGDLNPRHLTVVPTNMEDIPFVSATRQFFGSMWEAGKEVATGANVTSTVLRGIEHAGINRPLAGLAATLQGAVGDYSYSTTSKNNLLTTWDLYSLSSLQRIGGARPFEEAITRDAMYRVQSYEAKDQDKINRIGSAIRGSVRAGGEVSDEQYESFLESYVRAGGDQKKFGQFWQKQVKSADSSKVEYLIEKGNGRYSQYLQTMMGGYDPTQAEEGAVQ